MKDGLHLAGGIGGAILALALYVIGWGVVQRCFGAVPQSGDVVVIGDFEYVLVSVGDWARWTNAVARLEAVAERRWANEHKTDTGRRAWHGALKERRQSEDGRGMVYTYADGFVWVDEAQAEKNMPPAVRRMNRGISATQGASKPSGGTRLPPRLEAKQQALKARPAAREVNATFGPGGKVLKVEGAK